MCTYITTVIPAEADEAAVRKCADQWSYADFNGLFSEVLCLALTDTVKDLSGRDVTIRALER